MIALPTAVIVAPPTNGGSKLTSDAVKKKLTKKQVFDIIGQQERLDLEKSECGRRMIAFYDAQKQVYDKKGFKLF
ncbi:MULTISPECIES: hypothetical protein [unclassified Bradyrhizobium]|uniref:hypothetical protein n=1 Tax=unclassified Bradyrhizobium TaxID=2631580 RepID=UPI0033954956